MGNLCIVLRSTEAGEYISRHLDAVRGIIDATPGADLSMGRTNGECHLVLPRDYCERSAQALVDRLNALADRRGRPVLEAQLSYSGRRPAASRSVGPAL